MKSKIGPIVVTGATGFLGRHLIAELIKNNYDIHIISRDAKKAENLFNNEKVKIIEASLTDKDSLLKIPKYSTIFHCAAIIGSIRASQQEYKLANIEGTRNLVNAVITKDASSFVFVSSISAVGAVGTIDNPITETTIPYPKTYYGKSKLVSEQLVFNLIPSTIPVTIIRSPLIYGPGQNSLSGSGLLFKLCSKKIIPMMGTEESFIPLVYVKNMASGLIDLWLNNTGKEIFNLADAKPYTLKDLIEALNMYNNIYNTNNVPNESKRFIKIPYPIASSIGSIANCVSWMLKKDLGLCSEVIKNLAKSGSMMDINKALNFGYKPTVSLPEGVALTLSSSPL